MTFPFTRDRYVHRLLERDGMACLVERTNLETGSVHWEVVVLRLETREATLPSGRVSRPHECYPGPECWGERGWTYTRITDAEQKYAYLCRRPPQKGGLSAE